jgi:hypothetical protein
MLTYEKLSPGQKKWVLMINTFHPEIEDSITFDQIHQFHSEFMLLRETNSRYKVGLPNWLIRDNRIDRGVYFFPAEGKVYVEAVDEDTEIISDLEVQYQKYLTDYGVKNLTV